MDGTAQAPEFSSLVVRRGSAGRAGHHCAMPLLEYLGYGAVTRISLGLYNTTEDIDQLLEGLAAAEGLFQ